ncbi:adenylate kinase [Gaiella sp.]|uniref:adenylate kinase n=1 Tax=Gaiella sp. TaxID=2663207 RepID=UPI0032645196
MNVLVLGPQGSGKGTQAKRICAAHGIPHVSTGDMFRAAISEGTDLGRQVEPILASGELVPDELTVALIRERLSRDDASRGFVLDGFPRNLLQAEELDQMLEAIGRPLDTVLFFDLDDETATVRALGRAHEEGRTDDTPEVMARRLAIYHEQTEPVIERYIAAGTLHTLAADRGVDDVFAEIEDALRQVAR